MRFLLFTSPPSEFNSFVTGSYAIGSETILHLAKDGGRITSTTQSFSKQELNDSYISGYLRAFDEN